MRNKCKCNVNIKKRDLNKLRWQKVDCKHEKCHCVDSRCYRYLRADVILEEV